MESEQATPVDSIKDVFRSSVKVPEFDKHLKKARGHINQNVGGITIKMKTIVRKPLMIKMKILHLMFFFPGIEIWFTGKDLVWSGFIAYQPS